MTTVNLPLATTIRAFDECLALTTMAIATESTLDLNNNAFIGIIDKSKIKVTTRDAVNKTEIVAAGIPNGNVTVK